MARIHSVKKARKDQGNCRVCGTPILTGDPYKWARPAYRPKFKVCSKCSITPSMLSSSKMVAVWDAQTEAGNTTNREDLASAIQNLAQVARDVGAEYQESADNQREHFPDSEVAQENEDKAQGLEEWADELDGAADTVENVESEELLPEREEDESEEDYEERISDEKEQAEESTFEDVKSEVQDIIDSCP